MRANNCPRSRDKSNDSRHRPANRPRRNVLGGYWGGIIPSICPPSAEVSFANPGRHSPRYSSPRTETLEPRTLMTVYVATTASQFESDVNFAGSGDVVEVGANITEPYEEIIGRTNVTVEGEPGLGYIPSVTWASSVTQAGIEVEASGTTFANIYLEGTPTTGSTPYTQAIIADDAANTTFNHVNIEWGTYGIDVEGAGSSASLNDNTVCYDNAAGVQAGAGTTVTASGWSELSYDAVGLYINGAATVNLNNVKIWQDHETGIEDSAGAALTVTNSTFEYDTNSSGALGSCIDDRDSQPSNGNVTLSGDTFQNNTDNGYGTCIEVSMTGSNTQFSLENSIIGPNSTGGVDLSYYGSYAMGSGLLMNDWFGNNTSTSMPVFQTSGGSDNLAGCEFTTNVTPGPTVVASSNGVTPIWFQEYECSTVGNTCGSSNNPSWQDGTTSLHAMNAGDQFWLNASTYYANTIYGNGGGVGFDLEGAGSAALAAVQFCTIWQNQALSDAGGGFGGYGGGIFGTGQNQGGGVHLTSSIVQANWSSSGKNAIWYSDPTMTTYSDSYNWVDQNAPGLYSSDLAYASADLAPFQHWSTSPWNIAQVQSFPVYAGSPLIGHGNPWEVQNPQYDNANIHFTTAITGSMGEVVNSGSSAATMSSASLAQSTQPSSGSSTGTGRAPVSVSSHAQPTWSVPAPSSLPGSIGIAVLSGSSNSPVNQGGPKPKVTFGASPFTS